VLRGKKKKERESLSPPSEERSTKASPRERIKSGLPIPRRKELKKKEASLREKKGEGGLAR